MFARRRYALIGLTVASILLLATLWALTTIRQVYLLRGNFSIGVTCGRIDCVIMWGSQSTIDSFLRPMVWENKSFLDSLYRVRPRLSRKEYLGKGLITMVPDSEQPWLDFLALDWPRVSRSVSNDYCGPEILMRTGSRSIDQAVPNDATILTIACPLSFPLLAGAGMLVFLVATKRSTASNALSSTFLKGDQPRTEVNQAPRIRVQSIRASILILISVVLLVSILHHLLIRRASIPAPKPIEQESLMENLPKLIGSPEFKECINLALSYLIKHDRESAELICKYSGFISENKRTCMIAFTDPPTIFISKRTACGSCTWCARTLVHEAWHSKLYNDFLKRNHGMAVPDDVWTGPQCEVLCNERGLQCLIRISASDHEIECARRKLYTSDIDLNNDGKIDDDEYFLADW
jgi:hypothetical protein